MKDIKAIRAIVRLKNSVNGNPRFRFYFTDGTAATSSSGRPFCYQVGGGGMCEGDEVKVEYTRAGRIENMEPHGSTKDYVALWVCVDCIMHHANGECDGCYEGHTEEPLSLLDYTKSTMGHPQQEHECGRRDDIYFGDCDCETVTFSSSRCDGCGSDYHGERHAMTEWID